MVVMKYRKVSQIKSRAPMTPFNAELILILAKEQDRNEDGDPNSCLLSGGSTPASGRGS